MRIGILTYHWVFNHGANLQTLSSIGYFKRMGHDPVVINWIPKDQEDYYLKSTIEAQVKCFRDFQEKYFPLTQLCRNAKDVAKVIKKEQLGKVFIGSDTLFLLRKDQYIRKRKEWFHPVSCERFPNPFWGEFLDYGVDIPIYGFSIACLDTDARDFNDQKPIINNYLKRFNYLSVRDKATAEFVSYLTNGEMNPEVTPDPVFCFNKNIDLSDIESDILNKFKIKRDYYLMSMPQPYNIKVRKWAKTFEKIVLSSNADLFELPRQTGKPDLDIKQFPYNVLTPLEWYVLLKNAKGYVGGLMHPIVICIHNKVPFYCFDYYGRRRFKGIYVNYKTSKAYQVIEQCGLSNYYTNIAPRFKMFIPSPNRVFASFRDYNIQQLVMSSENMSRLLEEKLRTVL